MAGAKSLSPGHSFFVEPDATVVVRDIHPLILVITVTEVLVPGNSFVLVFLVVAADSNLEPRVHVIAPTNDHSVIVHVPPNLAIEGVDSLELETPVIVIVLATIPVEAPDRGFDVVTGPDYFVRERKVAVNL